MPTIVQLSDLHLGISATQQASLVEPMYSSLSRLKSQGITVDLLVITGDLFESTDVTAQQAVETIGTLTSRIREALSPTLPIILQPGNHDRRRSGIIGPHDPRIFDALKGGLDKRTLVTGCETPFLSELVSPEFHGLPWIIASFDSTFLPKGKFSAGGILRQEDLLQLAEQIMDFDPKFPLVLLIHHHLIPTPLTDLSRVDVNTTSKLLRWAARDILAGILANADREEMMMTALGAGTALSTLHAFDRPVVVLHGHKHYPAIRALHGPNRDQNDVLLVSAGSSATTLSWNESTLPDVAQLWPSYNLFSIDDQGALGVDVVAFGPRKPGENEQNDVHVIRPVLRAQQKGHRWDIAPVHGAPVSAGPKLTSLRADATLATNVARGATRADLIWSVRVQKDRDSALPEYIHAEDPLRGASMSELSVGGNAIEPMRLPARIAIPTDGTAVNYRLEAGVCTTRVEATRAFQDFTAFESIAFLNRYQSDLSELTLEGLPDDVRPFGSMTDLTTGQEKPVRVVREGSRYVLRASPCSTRTLLQIRWPLLRDGE